MRTGLLWTLAILVGIGVVIGLFAIVRDDDGADEQVSAAQWSADVCGAVLVWRGQIESIVDDIRQPTAVGDSDAEPQSEVPGTQTGLLRTGLERAVRATDTLVLAIDEAGIPDTPDGEASADAVEEWADQAEEDLDAAQDALDDEAESLEEALDQLGTVTGALATTLRGAVGTIAELAVSDPQLAASLRTAPNCRTLQEERTS